MTDRDLGTDRHGLRILDQGECIELLSGAGLGRVAWIDAGEPMILPVTFHWIDGHVVIETLAGSKLEAAAHRRPMAFEADSWDDAERSGWSVVIRGTGEVVTDRDILVRLEGLDLDRWVAPDRKRTWIMIRPADVTGRRTSA